ncbi:hypothetical protein K1T71_006178 [Dendrolimus kikuchii]|uniref:Uncharacterized protein n=1 Tax=Dendrolimus kikuchii TaxID=765133 RepID=A0ACC1D3L3_9NEOP|nr:hypothetical protein K1T71_006178 [Dendrolimus kikuchii]
MMMAGGVFPNMMMPNMIGSGMMQPAGMEVMGGSAMELVPQTAMDMSSMGASSISNTGTNPMEMGMMGGMLMDPSMMSMYPAMSADMTPTHEGKELVFKYCKLLPPEPGKPQPLRRTRPPGCRTIFVGGLPEKIRESIVREIFETYGRIITLRLSKKNFCHIRFDRESSVEAAMVVSGCKLVLTGSKDKDKDEKEEESRLNSGWIHVDYALSRDDQNEYERRQRQALRVQQAQIQEINSQQEIRRRNPEENQRWSPSPPRVMIFSSATVGQVAEKIKSEEHFSSTISTLLAWLERGECSKKTASQFYSMIQSTNSHIRRLFSEKMQAEDELTECKERVRNRIASVIELLEQVAKVFVAATHQRVWDHFTKPQRKNIETWQKMTQEFKTLKEEFNEKFNDDDYNENNEKKSEVVIEELQDLKRENESLQFQLEAYKNEIDVIKSDTQKEMEKFKAQFIARQALQKNFDRNPPLPEASAKPPTPPPPSPPKYSNQKPQIKEVVEAKCGEAKLIGVMSAFLQVHPLGASLDYVVSYVRALFPNITQVTIHHVLQKHSDVFKRTTSGVGVNIEHKWSFIALSQHETNS